MVLRRHTPVFLATCLVFAAALVAPSARAQEPPAGSGGTGTAGTTTVPSEPRANEPASGSLLPTDTSAGTPPAVDPSKDQQKLTQQGNQRPVYDGMIGDRPSEVYSED